MAASDIEVFSRFKDNKFVFIRSAIIRTCLFVILECIKSIVLKVYGSLSNSCSLITASLNARCSNCSMDSNLPSRTYDTAGLARKRQVKVELCFRIVALLSDLSSKNDVWHRFKSMQLVSRIRRSQSSGMTE